MKKQIAQFRAFNRFYTPIIGLLDKHYLDSDLSLTEARILFEIDHAQTGITAKGLTEILGIDKGYLSRLLVKFEKKQLISKTKLERDGRAQLLSLTEKGKDLFALLDKRSGDHAAKLLGSLTPGEVDTLIEHMEAIEKILGNIKTQANE